MEMVKCIGCKKKFNWHNSTLKKDLSDKLDYVCFDCFDKDKQKFYVVNMKVVWNCSFCKKDGLGIHEH